MSEWSPFAIRAAKEAFKPTERYHKSSFVQRVAKEEIQAIERRERRRNEVKAAIREKRWVEYDLATTLCLNCYGLGHRRGGCPEVGIIACSHCFIVNRFTKSCNCRKENTLSINPPPQVFRLAGDPEKPLFYADIKISFKAFEAQISTGQSECTINHHLMKWLVELTELSEDDVEQDTSYITVPITHRNETLSMKCKVVRYQEREIILGTEYLMKKGFTFTFDRINLNQNSIVLEHPRQIQRVYNLVPEGAELRRFVRHHGGALHSSTIYEIPNWPPTTSTIQEPMRDELSNDEACLNLDNDINAEDLENL